MECVFFVVTNKIAYVGCETNYFRCFSSKLNILDVFLFKLDMETAKIVDKERLKSFVYLCTIFFLSILMIAEEKKLSENKCKFLMIKPL